jgi:MFS family permease
MEAAVRKNVVHYFISDISVFVSVYLSFLTMVWLTYELTGSSADLGLVGFVQNVPFFLFSVLGGVVADNYNRRKIVIRFNIVFVILAFTVALSAFLKFLTFPLILVFSFLLGAFYSIYYPSMIAMVQDMVTDKDEFPRVMGAAASNAKTGQLLASSSFSFLISAFTVIGTFVSAFIFNVISLISISRVKFTAPPIQKKNESVINQIKTGLAYVISHKPIMAIVLMSSIISLVFVFVTFQMPMIDKDFLSGTSSDMGILFIAGAIGGLSSGIYLGRRKSTKNLLWFLVACAVISGISIIGLGFSRELWLSFIFAMGVDFSFIAAMGIGNTLLQLLSDDEVCGRVLGVNTMMSWGFSSVVMMLLGFLADSTGIEPIMMGIGIALFLSAVVYVVSLKFQKPALEEIYSQRNIPPAKQPI